MALLSAFFAGLVAIFGKIGIKGIDNTLATSVRAVIMALFLLSFSFILGKFKLLQGINSKALLFIALSGVAGALSWLCYFLALSKGPATGVAALDRTSVIFVLIFSAFILSEGITIKSAVGAILVALGAIFLSLK